MQRSLPRPDKRDAGQNWGGFKRHPDAPVANEGMPGWVKVEERDVDGRMVMPREAVASTEGRVYDPAKHGELGLRILRGYAPFGVLVGQHKLYDVSLMGMKGWRAKAHVTVDVGGREHEEAWFRAYKGQSVAVVDPGLPGVDSIEYQMTVVESGFHKKVHRVRDAAGAPGPERKSYEGSLELVETWASTFGRHRAELGKRAAIGLMGGVVGFAAKAVLDELLRNG